MPYYGKRSNVEVWQDTVSIVRCKCGDYEVPHDIAHAEMLCTYCPSCEREVPIEQVEDTECSAWFYWYCFPGCLPDSSCFGPFETEQDALAEALDDDEQEDDDEPTEPQEDDITTGDHQRFYQNGRLVLRLDNPDAESGDSDAGHYTYLAPGMRWRNLGTFECCEDALRAYMDATQYWPNCWFISDHGNAHLITFDKQ